MTAVRSLSLAAALLASLRTALAADATYYCDADLALSSPASDSTGTLGFGIDVAINNGTALVGAFREQTYGQAHLYDSQTGAWLHTFRPASPRSGDEFGRRVALNDDFAVIGGGKETYVFSATSYELLHVLPKSTRIDLDGGRAVLAMPGKMGIFDLQSGGLLSQIPSTATAVGLSGNYVVQGSSSSRAAFVYDWTDWADGSGTVLHMLQPAADDEKSGVGNAVAIDQGRIIVGAGGQSVDGTYAVGRAYVYDASTGALLRELTGSRTLRTHGYFGSAVALHGDIAVVSAPRQGDTYQFRNASFPKYESEQGAVYAFSLTSGEELARFATLVETGGWANYGFAVDYDGSQLIAGNFGWPKLAYVTSFPIPEPAGAILSMISLALIGVSRRRLQ